MPFDISAHLIIPAQKAMLVPQPTMNPRCRVSLLAGGLLIVSQDLPDHLLKQPQLGGERLLLTGVGPRFRFLQNLANLAARMVVGPGNHPNTHPIAMGVTNLAIIFHRQHSLTSVSWLSIFGLPTYGGCYGGSILLAGPYPRSGSRFPADFHRYPSVCARISWIHFLSYDLAN